MLHRLNNSGRVTVEVIIEPWASKYLVPPGHYIDIVVLEDSSPIEIEVIKESCFAIYVVEGELDFDLTIVKKK